MGLPSLQHCPEKAGIFEGSGVRKISRHFLTSSVKGHIPADLLRLRETVRAVWAAGACKCVWSCPGNTWQRTWQTYTPTNLPNHPLGEEELHPGLPHRVPCACAPGPEENTITMNQLITVFLSHFGAFLRSEMKFSKQPPHHLVTCAHHKSSFSFFSTSCDCFGTFMQLIIYICLRFPTVHYVAQNLFYSSLCNSLTPQNI